MDIVRWQELLSSIDEQVCADLFNAAQCGPFDGGCAIVANALQKVIGGEVVVLVRDDDLADHAVVFSGGRLWDYDGPLAPQQFIERFNKQEVFISINECVAFRPIRDGDLPDAIRDEPLVERLACRFSSMGYPSSEVDPHI